MAAPRTWLVLALIPLLVSWSGCVELSAAHLPDRLLEGRGGNGWEKDFANSQAEPVGGGARLAKSQTLSYQDRESERGYQGSLSVTTLRTLLRPNEDRVRDEVQDRIREQAESKGIRLEGEPTTGTRTLANRAESYWFTYNGTVDQAGFFSRNARVKIFGEVFQCVSEKTIVVTIGLAQTTDTRSVGGVPLPSEADDTTWREIVADPRGSIQGIRGSHGLAYNVAC